MSAPPLRRSRRPFRRSARPTRPATATATAPQRATVGGREPDRPPRQRLSAASFWVASALVSLVVGVAGAAITVVVVSREPKTYAATSVLSIDQPYQLATGTDPGEYAKLLELRLKYSGLVNTQAFAISIAGGSNIEPGQIQADAVTSVASPSLLFDVGARSGDPQQALVVAQLLSRGLVRYVSREQSGLGIKRDQRISLAVVTPAAAAVQVSPSRQKELAAGGFVGGVLVILGLSLQALRRRE